MPRAADRLRLLREHVAAGRRAVERGYATGIAHVHGNTMATLGRALSRAAAGRGRDPVSGATLQQLAAVTGRVVRAGFAELGEALASETGLAMVEGVRRVGSLVGGLTGGRTALDDVAVLHRAAAARRREVEEYRRFAARAAGDTAASYLQARLALTPVKGWRVDEAIAAAMSAADSQAWRVDRVARTEAAYAWNAAQDSGIAELAAGGVRGLMKRWTEHVSDVTGLPTDAATAIDSVVLHGQVQAPHRLFHMPADPRAPGWSVGRSWEFPPNRPNDRAVLLPWRPDWSIPAWTVDAAGGDRRRV